MVNKIKSTYIIVLIITFFALGSKVSAFTDKSIVEEKSYCYATLEDDFAEDIVIIVLNNSESLTSKVYSIV